MASGGIENIPGVGALLAMPMLVLNMGGEMVYILEQRLHAQAISSEKSKRVLTDVVKAMYSESFVKELFRPQVTYLDWNVRQIFDKLAHSSIMRLNRNSMDKLYDLMTMGFKQQMLHSRGPEQLLQVTLNHLETLRHIVAGTEAATAVETAERLTKETYTTLPTREWWRLKQELARFLQDRRVKVSLFLHDGIQNFDGNLVLDMTGPVPMGTSPPGQVRYMTPEGSPASTAVVAVAIDGCAPPATGDALDPEARPCRLGANMYKKDRKGRPASERKPNPGPNSSHSVGPKFVGRGAQLKSRSKGAGAASAGGSAAGGSDHSASPKHAPLGEQQAEASATAGLGLLSTLLRQPEAAGQAPLPIANLFPESEPGSAGAAGDGVLDGVISIDASDRRSLEDMAAALGFDDDGDAEAAGAGGGGDDLLDLMDQA